MNPKTKKVLAMKRVMRIIMLLAVVLLTATQAHAQRKISIFFDHVAEIAKQEKITIKEAATRIRQLGYEGIDIRVTMSDEQLNMLDSLGFKHACAIADINLIGGEQPKVAREVLDFMHHHDYTRLLLLPGMLPRDADSQFIDAACTRIAAFVKAAQREGIDVMVEDYDNPRAICYNTPILDHLFAASPQLNHVFDTGNYLFCDEDVMVALRHFRERVSHVHLKDRKAMHDSASLVIGTGIMPLKEVMSELLSSGYDGWFCIEHFGAPNMLKYAAQSIGNVNAVWDEVEK